MLTTAALLAATLLGATATAPLPSGADLSVDLHLATTVVLLPSAQVHLSVTNHGPDPLTSATVVVRFGVDAWAFQPAPCTFDPTADTLTCPFGALPAGATATISTNVHLLVGGPPLLFDNTATRTASTPADPNGANDTDTHRCYYTGGGGIPPPPTPTLHC